MLLENMNISRLMTHAQQAEGDKFRQDAKDNKKAKKVSMTIFKRNRVVKIVRSFSKSLQL